MKSDSLFDILHLKNNEILSEETYNFFFTSLKKKKATVWMLFGP